jgi:hypothetical protein
MEKTRRDVLLGIESSQICGARYSPSCLLLVAGRDGSALKQNRIWNLRDLLGAPGFRWMLTFGLVSRVCVNRPISSCSSQLQLERQVMQPVLFQVCWVGTVEVEGTNTRN